MKRKELKKWGTGIVCIGILGLLGVVAGADYVIRRSTIAAIYADVGQVPYRKVGLLLGTSPVLRSGEENLYFRYRIEAAARLFHTGKVSYLLLSGDNRKKGYNEPEAMKWALMKAGVPEECMVLDYAGFRTLDSVVRAYKVFGVKEPLIISQGFHNERAVYLASYYGMKAVAFNAQGVDAYYGFKTNLRELLARVKVFIDICLGVQPHFLGEETPIEEAVSFNNQN